MAHAQKPDFVFRRNGRIHLNRRGHQFSRLLAAEVCASVVVMLDTPCSEVVRRVMDTHSIHQFPFHFPSRASPCAITFQLDSTGHQFPSKRLNQMRKNVLFANYCVSCVFLIFVNFITVLPLLILKLYDCNSIFHTTEKIIFNNYDHNSTQDLYLFILV